jgi:hypothetical protein
VTAKGERFMIASGGTERPYPAPYILQPTKAFEPERELFIEPTELIVDLNPEMKKKKRNELDRQRYALTKIAEEQGMTYKQYIAVLEGKPQSSKQAKPRKVRSASAPRTPAK